MEPQRVELKLKLSSNIYLCPRTEALTSRNEPVTVFIVLWDLNASGLLGRQSPAAPVGAWKVRPGREGSQCHGWEYIDALSLSNDSPIPVGSSGRWWRLCFRAVWAEEWKCWWSICPPPPLCSCLMTVAGDINSWVFSACFICRQM